MSEPIQQSIDRKREEAIRTGVALVNLLTPEEAAFWREKQRQAINAKARDSYARNRSKEIEDQIRKQRTPEGKAAKLFFNTLARARRWKDKELEAALLEERTKKGKAALVDVAAIMRRLGRGHKWRIKPAVQPIQPKQPKQKRPSKFSRLTSETIFERTKGGETALHRAIMSGKLADVPREALSLEIFLAQNELGRTPLHYAAHFGCLSQIPRAYLTQQTLSVRNSGGRTPVHIAALDGHLDQIPSELLTPELMTMTDNSLATPQLIVDWKKRPPVLDSDNTRWRGDEISARQKGVLLFFGKSIRGLSKGQASDIIDQIFASPENKERWEAAKRKDLVQFKGTRLYNFILREFEGDEDAVEGGTLDSALDDIHYSSLTSRREEELAELETWLQSEDPRPSREVRRQPPKAKGAGKRLQTFTQLLILVLALVLLVRACR
jgi:hypothetical protein